MQIGSLEGSGVFDVFYGEEVIADTFSDETDGGVRTVTIGAYDESGDGFNYSYTAILELNEDDEILSLTSSTQWAFDDYWDDATHSPIAGSKEAYSSLVVIEEGDIVFGTYDPEAPLLYDFSGDFITSVEAYVTAESTDMGGGSTGERNVLQVGDYPLVHVESYLPVTAMEDTSSVVILSSSDTGVIGYDDFGSFYAKGIGHATLTVGNIFNANLGTIEVEVVEASSVDTNPPSIGFTITGDGYEDVYDPSNPDLWGRFTISLANGPAVFRADTMTPPPFDIEGDEISSQNAGIATAVFQNPTDTTGMFVDIVITPVSVGKTIITIPSAMGSHQYEVVVEA